MGEGRHVERARPAEATPEQGGGRPRVDMAEVPTGSRTPERTTEQVPKQRDGDQNINRREVDPNAAGERSRELYKPPVTHEDRKTTLEKDRETTATTGTSRERTIKLENGTEIKGLEHYDKKTGERTIYGANKDGTYTPHQIKDGNVQTLDSKGKPTGERVAIAPADRPQWNDPARNKRAEAEKGMDGNGKQHEPGKRDWSREERAAKNAEGKTPEAKNPEGKNAEGGKPEAGTKPGDGGNKPGDGGSKPAEFGGNKQVFTPEAGHNPHRDKPVTQQPENKPAVQQAEKPVVVQQPENPQGYRPHQQDWQARDRNGDGKPDGRGRNDGGEGKHDWRPGKQDAQDRPGGGKHDSQDRPGGKHQDERPQGGGPTRADWNRPENPRPEREGRGRDQVARPEMTPQVRPEQNNPHMRPELNPQARPEMHGRPEIHGRPDMLGRVDQTGRPDLIARTLGPRDFHLQDGIKDGGNLRNLDRALLGEAARGSRDFQSRDLQGRDFSSLRSLDAAGLKQFADSQRGSLRGDVQQNVRLNSDQLSAMGKGISGQSGEAAGRLGQKPGAEGERLSVNLGKSVDQTRLADGRDLANKPNATAMAEMAGKQLITRMLDLMAKQEMSTVPSAEQSRMMLRELMRNPKTEQIASQDLLSNMQRNLNQRNTESNSQQQAFTSRGLQLENAQHLSLRTKDQAEQTKDAQKTNEAITRNLDNNKPQTNPATQNLTNRTLDAANSTQTTQQKQEQQVRTTREAEDHNQVVKAQQQVYVQPDRNSSDNKIDSNQTKSAADNKADDKRLDEEQRRIKKEAEEKENNKEKQEQMAAFLAAKLKDAKEKAKEKEKEDIKDKSKQDPKQKTRLKYRVKKNDTLASISAHFLNNADHAPAIFHINRTLIPVTTYNGNSYANPPVDTMIWIPTDDDVDMFKESGVMKKYQNIGFNGVVFASAEEELASRFGRRWFGPSEEEKSISAPTAAFDPERAKRRANIENQLGAFNANNRVNGRINYVVRLGETLKSIALKHPLLQDVDMWRLLAETNDLPTDLDHKGCPIAVIKRGMTLLMPTYEQVETFRAKNKKQKNSGSHPIMAAAMPAISINASR